MVDLDLKLSSKIRILRKDNENFKLDHVCCVTAVYSVHQGQLAVKPCHLLLLKPTESNSAGMC
jgi:hypothetical protein